MSPAGRDLNNTSDDGVGNGISAPNNEVATFPLESGEVSPRESRGDNHADVNVGCSEVVDGKLGDDLSPARETNVDSAAAQSKTSDPRESSGDVRDIVSSMAATNLEIGEKALVSGDLQHVVGPQSSHPELFEVVDKEKLSAGRGAESDLENSDGIGTQLNQPEMAALCQIPTNDTNNENHTDGLQARERAGQRGQEGAVPGAFSVAGICAGAIDTHDESAPGDNDVHVVTEAYPVNPVEVFLFNGRNNGSLESNSIAGREAHIVTVDAVAYDAKAKTRRRCFIVAVGALIGLALIMTVAVLAVALTRRARGVERDGEVFTVVLDRTMIPSAIPSFAPSMLPSTPYPTHAPTLVICGTVTTNSSERSAAIWERLLGILPRQEPSRLNDPTSPQHEAACWIIDIDPRRLGPEDPMLVQRYALATFFHSTGSLSVLDKSDYWSWTNSRQWLTGATECEWFGVECDEGIAGTNGTVTGLRLGNNGLDGSLTEEFFEITKLTALDLSNNVLRGKPLGLIATRLTKLNYLNLQSNGLVGTIPSEISRMKGLRTLDLRDNELIGDIPDGLYDLAQLRSLHLEANTLTWPSSNASGFVNLQSLEDLNFDRCRLSEQSSLPGAIFKLPNLMFLSLERCNIFGTLPLALASLRKLKGLWLGQNEMEGTLTRGLFGLTSLEILDLDGNDLSGSIPTLLSALRSLKELSLESNKLTGTLPSVLFELSSLTNLHLGFNKFSGSIGDHVINLKNLSRLVLDNNHLIGRIPPNIFQLRKLRKLSIRNNKLVGRINPLISQLNDLYSLELDFNELTGVIPESISQLTKLKLMDLQRNLLNGTIPTLLGKMVSVEKNFFSTNQLTGSIPVELSRLANLTNLFLKENRLVGKIPSELGLLHNLKWLSLQSNQLSGTVPEEVCAVQERKFSWVFVDCYEVVCACCRNCFF